MLEDWFRNAWRLNEEMLIAALNEDLFLLKFDSPEKAKWVLESGRRSFEGGELQLEWWSPETGCTRRKELVQEAWIRVLGLPLHLWTPEILRKIGDVCGDFVEVDKITETKKEMKWARILIKMGGKARPRVVNILEGPRAFELQIWWELSPWVTGVHPVSLRAGEKKPEEEEEGWSRAVRRVGVFSQKRNGEGQGLQVHQINQGQKQSSVAVAAVGSVAGAGLIGGTGAKGREFKLDGNWAEGERLIQQAGPEGGPYGRAGLYPGLKRAASPEISNTINKSPAIKKGGSGRKEGLKVQQEGVHKRSSGWAARKKELIGSNWPGYIQVGPSKWLKDSGQGKKGFWGLKKGLSKARSGPVGVSTGSSEAWKMKEGGISSGMEGASSIPLADSAWICARGSALHAKEGWYERERTSSFESCWEKGVSWVSTKSPVTGGSGQGNEGERCWDGSSLALIKALPICPGVVDPKVLDIHTKEPRFDTLSSDDCSSSLFSIFGRPLLSGGSSGSGDLFEQESLGDMQPLRVVSSDGREWGKGIVNALMEDVQELEGPGPSKGEAATVSTVKTGYNKWEDSCLFKFSEYLGVTTVGFEEEILKLMRKLEMQEVEDKRKGNSIETRCKRELKKLECTINYSGKSQNGGGRDRGDFLLKLK